MTGLRALSLPPSPNKPGGSRYVPLATDSRRRLSSSMPDTPLKLTGRSSAREDEEDGEEEAAEAAPAFLHERAEARARWRADAPPEPWPDVGDDKASAEELCEQLHMLLLMAPTLDEVLEAAARAYSRRLLEHAASSVDHSAQLEPFPSGAQ